jgi:hypothetical protein
MNRTIGIRSSAKNTARTAFIASVAIFAVAGIARATFAAHAHRASSAASVRPAPGGLQLVPDKGKFKILANGKEAGQEEFEITPSNGDWIVRGTSTIQTDKGAAHINGTLELHADGSPVRYDWTTDGDKKAAASVTFSGRQASIDLNMANTQPYTQQLTFSSTPIAVLDNNLYDQYAVLAGLYDWSKGGVQTFSVLVPQSLTPGSVSVESVGKQDSEGKQMDELVVKSDDLELDLFLDKGRLMRIVAPDSNAEIVRE